MYDLAAGALREQPGVLLAGPAGIGKSHLLARLVDDGLARGVRVLRCSPVEAELPLPFMCLIDLFETVADEVVGRLPSGQRDALRAALLRGDGPDTAAAGGRVHLAVLTLLRLLAADGPVWIVVDDIQWMDEPTAQILGFVARRAAGTPLRVLATERVPGGEPAKHLRLCPPGTVELAVPPLSAADLAPVLAAHCAAPVPAATAREIHRVARGNPLYALEILRSLPADGPGGKPPAEGLAVPGLLRGLLLDRLRSLPADVHGTLVLASAASRPDLTLLATAGGAGVTAHLETAERLGVVRISQEGHIHFDHPLVRSAVYSEASGRERREAHGRLAAAATEPVERARHLALANPARDEGVALTLMDAAASARRRGAPATAAELAALAVARTPAGAGPARTARRLACAEYHCDAGRWDAARHEASAILAEEKDPSTRVKARIVLLKCAGQALEGEGRLIEEGLAESAGSPALEAQLRYWSSARELLAGRVDQAVREARRGAELAQEAQDTPAHIDALTSVAYLQRLAGDPGAEATLASVFEKAREQGVDDARLLDALITQAIFHLHTNRLAEAAGGLTSLLARFGEQVTVEDQLRSHVALTDVHLRAGDCPAALRAAASASVLNDDVDGAAGPVTYAMAAAESYGGSLERARELAEQGARAADRDGDRFWYLWNLTVLGRSHLLGGDPVRAAEVLREVRKSEQTMGIVDPAVGRWHADLAEALVGAGSSEEAAELIDTVSRVARRLGRMGVLGCMERAAALRHAALGELGAAAVLLESSAARLRAEGLPLELARTLASLADVERRRRRQAAARKAAAEASKLCRDAGAAAWFGWIEAHPRGARRPQDPLVPQLTASELRVAELAADGATNREIATACYLSIKTVEASLSRVYRKLGVRSRTELAKTLPDWVGPANP